MSGEDLRARILALVGEYATAEWPARPFVPGETPVPVSGRVFDGDDVRELVDASLDFLAENSLEEFTLAIFNLNDFAYVP